jgi:hypothetical protein
MVDGYGIGGLTGKVFLFYFSKIFRFIIGAADLKGETVAGFKKKSRRIKVDRKRVDLCEYM